MKAAEEAAAVETAKKAADEAAAKAVTDAIGALPEKIDLSDKEAVVAARKAYDALTEDQKNLVSADVVAKLTAAEAQLKATGRISLSYFHLVDLAPGYCLLRISKMPSMISGLSYPSPERPFRPYMTA